ncbi:MAG: fumarylacetoacetate hydrolase family protein [Nitrososphaerales archaeon]
MVKWIRYVRDNEEDYGILYEDKIIPKGTLEKILKLSFPKNLEQLIESWENYQQKFLDLQGYKDEEGILLSDVSKVLPPLLDPPKIICLGLNYYDHAKESNMPIPDEPPIFLKPRTCINGPYDDVIVPPITKQVDYEVELAIIIGKKAKRVSEERALGYVFGYICFNDISARDLQFKDKQWTRGKSLDTFAPIGPWIVTKDELNPDNLTLSCKVNGELRQNSSTKFMIYKSSKIVSWLSQGITLEPGDIIATGTPSGVGAFYKPEPKYLEDGDIVECFVEGIGSLRNRIVFK